MAYYNARGNTALPTPSSFLLKACRFHDNWRDLVGGGFRPITPLAKADHRLDPKEFISLDPNSADYFRPTQKSPLATDGAGKTDSALPIWVGAVPPRKAGPWDWHRTWKMRLAKQMESSK